VEQRKREEITTFPERLKHKVVATTNFARLSADNECQ
jgi:hypothetical protein